MKRENKVIYILHIVIRLCGVHFVGNPCIVEKFHLKLCIVNKTEIKKRMEKKWEEEREKPRVKVLN